MASLFPPPGMVAPCPSVTLLDPPPTAEEAPDALFLKPPAIVDPPPAARLLSPPPMLEPLPLALLPWPTGYSSLCRLCGILRSATDRGSKRLSYVTKSPAYSCVCTPSYVTGPSAYYRKLAISAVISSAPYGWAISQGKNQTCVSCRPNSYKNHQEY